MDTFLSLPLQVDDKSKTVVCSHHSLPICDKCNLDFKAINNLHRSFSLLPPDLQCPPPPNKPPATTRSAQISKLKESGNRSLKMHNFSDAVRFYSLALEMALARPPWEPIVLCRDESVLILASRSTASFLLGDFVNSLADAEACVELKKQWSKGHYRKAKALQAFGKLEEAKKAVEMGLTCDPNDNECNLLLKDLKKAIEAKRGKEDN
jgi:translocation protein SEC72